jgi:hypothetical protein
MNASNKKSVTLEEVNEMDEKGIFVGVSDKNDFVIIGNNKNIDGKQLYVLLDKNNPYKSNIRLKSWITAYGRNIMANLALDAGLNNVIRIHTDNITLIKEFDFEDINFIPEEKTTGLIKWRNVNDYDKHHTCDVCQGHYTSSHKSRHLKSDKHLRSLKL